MDGSDEVRQAFRAFDRRCAGFLTLSDVKGVFREVAPHVAERKIEAIFFEFDDDLSDGDMEHDQTDLDPERKRREDLAQLKSSQQAKFELAKRAAVEASGKEWHWVHRDGDIEPSYAVAGEVGYDVPCVRDAALLASGEPRMMLGA